MKKFCTLVVLLMAGFLLAAFSWRVYAGGINQAPKCLISSKKVDGNTFLGKSCVTESNGMMVPSVAFSKSSPCYFVIYLRDDSWYNGKGRKKGKTVTQYPVMSKNKNCQDYTQAVVEGGSGTGKPYGVTPGHQYHAYTRIYNETDPRLDFNSLSMPGK